MHKEGKNGKFISPFSFLLFFVLFLLFTGCKHNVGKGEKNHVSGKRTQITESDFYPAFVKYRSFQNPDSSWGYTIFVNSKPYLHYSRISFGNKGFPSKKDADIVAETLVKMIQNGDPNPKLSKKITDSIELEMKLIKTSKVNR
jgi:hypothetical protein